MSTPNTPTPEAIVAKLQGMDRADAGAVYLSELRLTQPQLVAVAEAAGMTRVNKLKAPDLRLRIIRQTITARIGHTILRTWRTCGPHGREA